MRKRRNPASRPSVHTKIVSSVGANARPSNKLSEKTQPNAEGLEFFLKVLTGVLVPAVVAALTLLAAVWQFNASNERIDRARFIDGALVSAQETNLLLNEGYYELAKLLNATASHGWKAFSKGAFHDYMEFHQHWRQRAVSAHFKLARYFGKDLADQLIHIDEINLNHTDNLGSSNPCTPPGTRDDFDMEKMTFQAWCTITRISLLQDEIEDKRTAKSGNELLEIIQAKHEQEDFAKKLLNHYNKTMVSHLRQLNERLTQLGQPQTTVVIRSTSSGAGSH